MNNKTRPAYKEPTFMGVPLRELDYHDVQIALLDGVTEPSLAKKVEEYTNDSPEKQEKGNIKYDVGKTPIYQGLIDYFPRAISAVAGISAFGASKYAWKGWEGVEDGYNRYSNAMHRHELYKATQGLYDLDSGLLHDAHFAWGALARLELFLRQQEQDVGG